MNKGVSFNDALKLLVECNPNKKPEFLRDKLISGILCGDLPLTTNDELNDFYMWCKHFVDPNPDTTAPLNWINLFLYSSMADKLKEIDTPGLPHILESVKNSRVGKNFNFILCPSFLKKSYLDEFKKSGSPFLSFNAKLRWKKNNFYFLLNNNYKILMKFCWIIKENKDE